MKTCARLSRVFALLAILLSNVMCAVVAWSYCDMLWGIRVSCYSAPASVAFLYAIPFLAGIFLCAAASALLHKHAARLAKNG